jgi:hypothetical protein
MYEQGGTRIPGAGAESQKKRRFRMFHHHQEIDAIGRVRSVQTFDLPFAQNPTPAGAAEAGRRYWDFLRRTGLGVLQVNPRPDGGVDVDLPGLLLLSFAPPAIIGHDGGFAVRYRIREGSMVQRSGINQGYLQMGLGRRRLSLAVECYHAALVGPNRHPLRVGFYLVTQSAVHVAVARGYLGLLARRSISSCQSGPRAPGRNR